MIEAGAGVRCDPTSGGGERPVPVVSVDAIHGAGAGAPIRCARCGHAITDTAARIAVNGEHVFERINPHGYAFRFGCFSRAPGCAPQGVPSKQATWFADHFWYVQACAACAQHLGWLFFRGEASFYGLVLDAIIEPDPDAHLH